MMDLLQAKIVKKGFWDFSEDIPLLTIGKHPESDQRRVKEEIEVFNIWKKFNPAIPFSNLRYRGRGIFIVDVDCVLLFGKACRGKRKLSISIICPRGYPRSFPQLAQNPRNLDDLIFMDAIRRNTRAVFMCIPAIERVWWFRNAPYAGIAHFLNIFLIWFSISSNKKGFSRISFYEKRSVIV